MRLSGSHITASMLALGVALTSGACQSMADPMTEATPAPSSEDAPMSTFAPQSISTPIIGADGEEVGQLDLSSAPGGVLIRAQLSPGALTPGWHGLHLHQTPDCSDIGVFKLSGGHVGKVAGGHGLLNPAGPEGGDLPNIYAAADGSAAAEMFSPRTTFDALQTLGGFAMIIHAGADDHITQPIGGAGGRVACAAYKFDS